MSSGEGRPSWSAGLRRRFSSFYDAFFLPRYARGSHAPGLTVPRKPLKKLRSRNRGAAHMEGLVLIFCLYSTFLAKIKALGRRKCEFLACGHQRFQISG